MHAVILKNQNKLNNFIMDKDYILCHIRKIDANYKSSKSQSKRKKAGIRNKQKEENLLMKKFKTA